MPVLTRSKILTVGVVAVFVIAWIGLRTTVWSDLARDDVESEAAESLSTMRVVEGRVEVSRGSGEFEAVAATIDLAAGSKIRTGEGALAEIEYFDGSLSRIGPNTTYEIVELTQESKRTVIVGKLGIGETFHDVKELTGSGSRFEIQESDAIASVRGTRFAARCLPPLPCGIAVVEGTVIVTPSSGEPVSVEAGQRVTIDDAGLLGAVTEVSPDDPWLNRNRDLDAAEAAG